MIFVGIDPGMSGAVAFLDEQGNAFEIHDTPMLTIKRNKSIRREFDRPKMVEILRFPNSVDRNRVIVAIERVNSMPGQGVASSFSFGMGYGIWLGIIAALGYPVDLVHPVRWKKIMLDSMGKDKDASRIRAKELFGNRVDLSLKKHHGRADALLIAEWRRRIG